MSTPAARGARPTLADVAREAGVSTALVSIVMRGVPGASDETRVRVRAVADAMGYVPDQRARKLRQNSSRLVGVTFDLHQPFHGDVVEHLYTCAAERGYDLAISAVAPTRDEPEAVETLVRERCEVAIMLGSRLPDTEVARIAARVPLLLVARATAVPEVASVRGDDEAGVGLAVDHLVDLGHHGLVHIDGGTAPGTEDRRRGFLAAAERRGLTDARIVAGGATEEAGARAMADLLSRPDGATAVVAFNDHCAAGVLDVVVRAGLDVPADWSVVGYDDSRLATTRQAQMTTVAQSASEMAAEAVSAALDLLVGRPARHVVLSPSLVVRSTTGRPRG